MQFGAQFGGVVSDGTGEIGETEEIEEMDLYQQIGQSDDFCENMRITYSSINLT